MIFINREVEAMLRDMVFPYTIPQHGPNHLATIDPPQGSMCSMRAQRLSCNNNTAVAFLSEDHYAGVVRGITGKPLAEVTISISDKGNWWPTKDDIPPAHRIEFQSYAEYRDWSMRGER